MKTTSPKIDNGTRSLVNQTVRPKIGNRVKKTYKSLLFVLSFSLVSCATNKSFDKEAQEDFNKAAKDLIAVYKEHNKYVGVMNNFISYTKNKNVNKMLALTSKTTIRKNGISVVKNLYSKSIIPEINSCTKMYTNKKVARATKELTGIGSGFIYIKYVKKKTGNSQ